MSTLPSSYNTESIYSAVPQYLQDQDAANGYPLWYFLYSICQTIDRVDVLTRDNMGPGLFVEANFSTTSEITDAKLVYNIDASSLSMTIFDTDSTWYNIDTSQPFPLLLENEEILVQAGVYNWEAPYVILPIVDTSTTSGNPSTTKPNGRGYNNTTPVPHNASSGADGSLYLDDYGGAPGWSQVLDINRCPDYALPWLAQFVGAEILPGSNMNRQQMVQKIKQRAGFDRATVAAIVAELVALTNEQLAPGTTPLSANQIIVLEKSQFNAFTGNVTNGSSTIGIVPVPNILYVGQTINATGFAYGTTITAITNSGITVSNNYTGSASTVTVYPNPVYSYNEYALTLLVPSYIFSSYTYQSLEAAAATAYGTTYTNLQSYISSIGGLYFDLAGSTVPSNNSPYVNFVYRYRPAGMQIFVGGY